MTQTSPYSNDWRWNSQAPPPINGQARTDSRDWVGATQLFISNLTDTGADVSATLLQIQVGTALDITQRSDNTRYVSYDVQSAPAAQSGCVSMAVSYVENNGTLPNSGTICTLNMTIAGSEPPEETMILWTLEGTDRPTRWIVTCTCAHGSVREVVATTIDATPENLTAEPAIIESTASNLLRRTGCACAGLRAG